MEKKFVIAMLSFYVSSISTGSYAASLSSEAYSLKIDTTNELSGGYSAEEITKKLMQRSINTNNGPKDIEFGVHGMERPYIHADKDKVNTDKAFELLSRAGVDSLRSTEAAWHRLSDNNGNLTNFSELDFQLEEAKKYGMTHLFVVGYPPGKYSVSGNKLSAVNPKYYSLYRDYYLNLLKHFNGYNVEYLELGNEVDAGKVWWIKSTPQQYVNEMCFLHTLLKNNKSSIKTVAFSATYSRDANLGNDYGGGRQFLTSSLNRGIDKCTDSYSLHHFSMVSPDSFPDYMHKLLSEYNISKPLLDTEQLDTSTLDKDKTQPYSLIKLFTRGFFLFDLKRIDYYMAKDFLMGRKFYTMGLFDINLNPKPRLLAYAASVDALKGKKLISINAPLSGIEAYILKNRDTAKYKYTIVLWNNTDIPKTVLGIDGSVTIERWDLTENTIKDASNGISVTQEPIIIYCNSIPLWEKLEKYQILKNKKIINELPMP